MMKIFHTLHPVIGFISLIILLFPLADLHAEDDSVSLSTSVAEETKGFLSDPARSGSLVGTIIAGAAMANPLAPILGSITGYFVGKETDYTNNTKTRQSTYARRSIIPENNQQVAILSELSDGQLQQTEQLSALELLKNPKVGEGPESQQATQRQTVEQQNMSESTYNLKAGERPQNEQTNQLGLPQGTENNGNLQQQIAFACSNVKVTQQLPVYCYYYSQ